MSTILTLRRCPDNIRKQALSDLGCERRRGFRMAIHETVHRLIPHVERPMADPPRPQSSRGRRRAASDYGLMGVALLAGPANVIMELARPGVGHGVAESRVESGRIDRHPIKRARTTFTYIAVANAGTDAPKAAFRSAVNRAHPQGYSTPDSPVP